jgi:LysM repeat protein
MRQPRLLVAVFTILALHVTFLAGLLIQGCKREGDQTRVPPAETTNAQVPTGFETFTNPPVEPGPVQPQPGLPTPPVAVAPETNQPAETFVAPTMEPPVLPPVPATKEYKVARGDTFTRIAREHGVSFSALKAANPQVQPSQIKVGQKLQIPAPQARASGAANRSAAAQEEGANVYVVKRGDTLTRIAKAHGTTAAALRAANNLQTDRILVGQRLQMPAPAQTNAPGPSAAPGLGAAPDAMEPAPLGTP